MKVWFLMNKKKIQEVRAINRRKAFIIITFLLVYITALFIYPGYENAWPAGAKKQNKMVLGYYTEDYPGDKLSYTSLAANSSLIDSVAFFNYLIDDKGNLNKFSLRLKLDLVNCYNIAGIAVWRLGFEDATFWQVVRDKL